MGECGQFSLLVAEASLLYVINCSGGLWLALVGGTSPASTGRRLEHRGRFHFDQVPDGARDRGSPPLGHSMREDGRGHGRKFALVRCVLHG